MQRLGEEKMVELCDICGDVGFPEVIVTCSKCKVFREHVYCMRIYLTNIPEDWICESCQSKNVTASPCKVNQDSGRQAFKRQRARAVTTGKVKFIPADEVIKLSSGNFPVKPRPANSTLLTQKASVGSKNIISEVPSLRLKSNPSIAKLPRNDGGYKSPMTDKHASLSKGPMKEHICENQRLSSTIMPDKEVQTLDLKIEKHTKGATCEALPARNSLPVTGSGDISSALAERKNSNMEKSVRQSIPENFNLYYKCLPSSIAAWRGQFQILQAAASGKMYDEFKAEPPCTVNSKAYNFSGRMPSVLQLKSLPMLNILIEVFQNDSPSLQDIALYFFPSDNNTGRSRKNLNSIFEFMNEEKLMLRSIIDGVELLVFTSNELDADSRGTIATVNADAGYFLWGVFRRSKIDEGIETLSDMEPVDMIGGKDFDIERLLEKLEPVNMDIDMIGGKDVVGRTDIIVRKDEPITLHSDSTSKEAAEETIIISSSHKNLSALSKDHAKKIKTEYSLDPSMCNKEYHNPLDKLDVPPGFGARIC